MNAKASSVRLKSEDVVKFLAKPENVGKKFKVKEVRLALNGDEDSSQNVRNALKAANALAVKVTTVAGNESNGKDLEGIAAIFVVKHMKGDIKKLNEELLEYRELPIHRFVIACGGFEQACKAVHLLAPDETIASEIVATSKKKPAK